MLGNGLCVSVLCRKSLMGVLGMEPSDQPAGDGAGRLERVDQKASVVRVPPLGVVSTRAQDR